MLPVATAAEMRALDAATIRAIGLPGAVLMETAGRAVAAAARAACGDRGLVAVVCGGGNNGGDGFVVARVLHAAGIEAPVLLAVPRDSVRGDARLFLDAHEHTGGVVVDASGPDLGALDQALARAAVIVDALLGTGLTRAVDGHLAAVIERINAAPGVRLAVDVPSGLCADTGQPLGVAVRADRTITMAVAKIGLVSAPGCAWAGAVEIAEIGIPRRMADHGTHAALVEAADIAGWRPRATALDHKGRRGHVLVVGGSPGKRGAARLAATAALRAGAGLCTLAGPAAGGGELVAPDAVMTAALASADDVAGLLTGKAAVVIGPGLPDDAFGAGVVAAALASGLPTVVDATGLALLAPDAGAAAGAGAAGAAGGAAGAAEGRPTLAAVARARGPVVLTPHPGEAGRLLGVATAVVESDRMAAVRALAVATRAVVVLKGARTLICDGRADAGDGAAMVTINSTGGPALATAGSGDVLAGVIGALLAQGLAPVLAARVGAWIHGAAGDALAARLGARGVIASDLPEAIAALPWPT